MLHAVVVSAFEWLILNEALWKWINTILLPGITYSIDRQRSTHLFGYDIDPTFRIRRA